MFLSRSALAGSCVYWRRRATERHWRRFAASPKESFWMRPEGRTVSVTIHCFIFRRSARHSPNSRLRKRRATAIAARRFASFWSGATGGAISLPRGCHFAVVIPNGFSREEPAFVVGQAKKQVPRRCP